MIQSVANAAAFDDGGGGGAVTANDSLNGEDCRDIADSMSLKDLSQEASKMGVGRKVLILDARSYTAAVGNRARGGGVECEDYYSNTEILFMNLVNIHAIRKSFIQLRQLCGSSSVSMDSSSWFQTLDNTKWLPQIGSLLKAAIRCVDALEIEGRVVLVHCSDGWDRTPQITSLSQLMLDPYYRSMDGFQVLVKKEWFDYGHKMADRCGNPFATSDSNERSPIFLQWLDCVHQLLLQYPTHFEFNQGFLIKLARHTYSNLFGNFLCNSLMERKKNHVQEQTRSIWSFLRSDNQAKYHNLLYNKLEDTLRPKTEVRGFLLWREVFTAEQQGSGSGIDSMGSSKQGSASEGSSSAPNSSRDESEERREQTNGNLSPSSQTIDEECHDKTSGKEATPVAPLADTVMLRLNGFESSTDTLVPEEDKNNPNPLHSVSTVATPLCRNGAAGEDFPSNETAFSASRQQLPASIRPLFVNPDHLIHPSYQQETLIDDDGLEAHVDLVQERMKEIFYQHQTEIEALQTELKNTKDAIRSIGEGRNERKEHIQRDFFTMSGSEDTNVGVVGSGTGINTGSTTSEGSWDNVDEKDMKPTLWMPDHMTDYCTRCQKRFWIADRKHHCRICGLIFCHSCSSNQAPVPKENLLQPVRVCDDCIRSSKELQTVTDKNDYEKKAALPKGGANGPVEAESHRQNGHCDIDEAAIIEPAAEATDELA